MNALMVDDHEMFLQGLKNLLSVMAPSLRVDISVSIDRALLLSANTSYDLVLLDWHLAECDGAQAIHRMRAVGCLARIVVLSGESNSALIRSALDLGAAGFIPKTYSSEAMIAALHRVLAGGIFLPNEVRHGGTGASVYTLEDDPRLGSLTVRQIEAYRAAARGLPNKLVARELGIAESTVKSHLSAVYAALGVRNRTEALYLASRDGTRIA